MIELWREICKPVLKLDFTAHGKMESLAEFELKAKRVIDVLLAKINFCKHCF
jgi:hypothetical protein